MNNDNNTEDSLTKNNPDVLDAIVSEALESVDAEPVDLSQFEVNKIAQRAAEITKTVKQKPKRTRTSNLPDSGAFKEFWNGAENVAQVCEHFGINKSQASAKASQLRNKGHELKKFPRGRKKGQTTAGLVTKATMQKQIEALSNALLELGGNPAEVLASLETSNS